MMLRKKRNSIRPTQVENKNSAPKTKNVSRFRRLWVRFEISGVPFVARRFFPCLWSRLWIIQLLLLLQAELLDVVRRRRGRGDTSEDEEDLGLPRSPCNSPTVTDKALKVC